MRIGDALIGIVSLRQRCIMTTFDPDTAEQDTEVLLRIHRELDGSSRSIARSSTGDAPRRRCRRASVTLPMAAADAMAIVKADASRHSRAAASELRNGELQVRDGDAGRVRRSGAGVDRRALLRRGHAADGRVVRAGTRDAQAGRGYPSIRVELRDADAELDQLPAADGVSPAAEGASDERHLLWTAAIASSCARVEPVGAARGLTTLVQLLATATPMITTAPSCCRGAHRRCAAVRVAQPGVRSRAPVLLWQRGQAGDRSDRALQAECPAAASDGRSHQRRAARADRLRGRARFVTLVRETSPGPASASLADALPVVVSPVDHAYFDVPDAEAWSDPHAGGWSEPPRSAGRAPPPVGAGRADVFHLVGAGNVATAACRRPIMRRRCRQGGQTMTSDGVATGADELKQKLAQQIDAARNKLESLKKDVVSLHEDDIELLRKKRDELRAHRAPARIGWQQAQRRHRPLEGGEDRAHPRRGHVVAAAARAGQAGAPRRARRGLRAAHGQPGGHGLRGG